MFYSPLAQLVEQWTVNPSVASSSLAGRAKDLQDFLVSLFLCKGTNDLYISLSKINTLHPKLTEHHLPNQRLHCLYF